MRLIISLLIPLLLCVNIQAMNFKLGIWSKDPCQGLDPSCLPRHLYNIESYEITEPPLDSAQRLVIQKGDYKVKLLWAKKKASGGYYSFQMELFNQQGTLVAQCARYESLDTFESAPVGSCSGTDHSISKIVGISIYLP